ncbi:hypothetical protein MVES_002009 [Malassezia vespertilionis]|uniref:PROP1-like PPR domain-containing protein n=2 Tax=Malassezia vespertilionis TaxID=2020962 RepID=A0A2N1JC58_9BASI|nr:hypothetical protein MVES_002009 [Malassezia vespertilionis]
MQACDAMIEAMCQPTSQRRPIPELMCVYRSMLTHGPAPGHFTFARLLDALCDAAMDNDEYLSLALELTDTAHAMLLPFTSTAAYNAVLRACAKHGKSTEAVHVLAYMEDNLLTTKDADSYQYMIESFARNTGRKYPHEPIEEQRARRRQACTLIFATFESVAQGVAAISRYAASFSPERCAGVWYAMLHAHFAQGSPVDAVSLFERMIAIQASRNVLPVTEQITSTMVLGFVRADDCRSAVQWLRQLQTANLAQPNTAVLEEVLASVMAQPHAEAVQYMVSLAEYFLQGAPVPLPVASCCVRHLATLLEMPKAWTAMDDAVLHALDVLAALARHVFASYTASHPMSTMSQTAPVAALFCLVAKLAMSKRPVEAAALFAVAVASLRNADQSAAAYVALLRSAYHLPMAIADAAAEAQGAGPDDACVRFTAMASLVSPNLRGMHGSFVDGHNSALIRLYEATSRDLKGDLASLPLQCEAWQCVVDAYCVEEHSARDSTAFTAESGFGKLLKELALLAPRIQLDLTRAQTVLHAKYGDAALGVLQPWTAPDTAQTKARHQVPAPSEQHLLRAALQDGAHAPHLAPFKSLDMVLGNAIQALARPQGEVDVESLYQRVEKSVAQGKFPPPSALAVLITAFGRMGRLETLDALYTMGLHVLASHPNSSEWRTSQWVQLEDGMVTALSHSGAADRANGHRERLIASGHAPSASSYAALIATIQERTDDAVVAEDLFNESQQLGVRPTTYLYNTVISKLSRARKAEQALRLFDAMRDTNLRPSSVTYGAAINACVRTGDEARATQLFAEMEAQPSFQPRVPPYNTMIQYYVHSCMDRTKALRYYEKMQKVGVRPSAHTYKLLLDVWGAIAPVQPDKQQLIFSKLVADRLVGVQGTHWASLIHTQGAVLRDLDRALEIFESIAEHAPAVGRSRLSTVPDAVVYESLFSVFVAHHRSDLMPAYLARMIRQGIFPTAYIANLLIKGYAQDGPMGLIEARRVFDAMIDPPAGIAAAGNHLPRHQGAGALGLRRERFDQRGGRHGCKHTLDRTNVLGALVNREPSTYDAMIRAELSFGHTAQAMLLLERMEARAFPAALLNRARALFDHATPCATST